MNAFGSQFGSQKNIQIKRKLNARTFATIEIHKRLAFYSYKNEGVEGGRRESEKSVVFQGFFDKSGKHKDIRIFEFYYRATTEWIPKCKRLLI